MNISFSFRRVQEKTRAHPSEPFTQFNFVAANYLLALAHIGLKENRNSRCPLRRRLSLS